VRRLLILRGVAVYEDEPGASVTDTTIGRSAMRTLDSTPVGALLVISTGRAAQQTLSRRPISHLKNTRLPMLAWTTVQFDRADGSHAKDINPDELTINFGDCMFHPGGGT
jgi:hypothetical protein